MVEKPISESAPITAQGAGAAAMTTTTKAALVAFTALRLVLVLHLLPSPITTQLHSLAISSALVNPIYTVQHLREGNFLLDLPMPHISNSNLNSTGAPGVLDQAYAGMAFHLPPLVLYLFRPILKTIESTYVQDVIIGILFAFVDLAVALCLYEICRRLLVVVGAEREMKLEAKMDDKIRPRRAWVFGLDPRKKDSMTGRKIQPPVLTLEDMPELCSLCYYCNPISLVASCGTKEQSLQSFSFLCLLLAILEATSTCTGRRPKVLFATLWLALASYVEFYSLVYVVPVTLFIAGSCGGNMLRKPLGCAVAFLLWSSLLHMISAALVGNYTTVWLKTYGFVYGYFDLAPNMSLHWYFFIQMFDRFRRYFVSVFALLQFIFVVPLTIRLHKYPGELTAALFLLGTLLKPVQTLHDASLGLALLLMSPRTLSRMGNASLVSLFAIVVPAMLNIMFYRLWLESGTGNANYMFFQCLAYNVFVSIIALDFISSTVKRDKALRLTEQEAVKESSDTDTCKAKSD